jgi:hypothetical protein
MARKSPEKFEDNKDVYYSEDPNSWPRYEQGNPENEPDAVPSSATETSWFYSRQSPEQPLWPHCPYSLYTVGSFPRVMLPVGGGDNPLPSSV